MRAGTVKEGREQKRREEKYNLFTIRRDGKTCARNWDLRPFFIFVAPEIMT